jgi:hypothetical protein
MVVGLSNVIGDRGGRPARITTFETFASCFADCFLCPPIEALPKPKQMIRFFRSVRQNLIAEGRLGRYLAYAFGEILLVVIGILIALQINNWNQERKNRKEESVFVKSLLTDLREDIKMIDSVVEYNEIKMIRLDSLLDFVQTDINSLDSHNDIYLLIKKAALNQSLFRNQSRSLARMSNIETSVISTHLADSIASFEQLTIRLEEQSKSYRDAHDDLMVVLAKLIKIYCYFDEAYYDNANKTSTGKPFPRLNEDKALQTEFFNHVAILKGVTKNYVSNFLKAQKDMTIRLMNFLESEYEPIK